MTTLGALTWPDLQSRSVTVLVPVGSVEQHGPHLPLRTDTIIATAVAEGVADRLGPAYVVAPALEYGASGEHQDFPGTVSIGHEALGLLLVELVRSASVWAHSVLFVNGHGGNLDALRDAVALLRSEGRTVGWTTCGVPGADAHAGLTETSLLLALAPDRVALERVVVGETAPVGDLLADLRASGVRAVSASGVLGDPRGASAERGRELLAAIVQRVAAEAERLR